MRENASFSSGVWFWPGIAVLLCLIIIVLVLVLVLNVGGSSDSTESSEDKLCIRDKSSNYK